MAEKGASPRPSLVPAIAGQVIDVKFMTMQTSSNGPCHGENPRCWLIISRGPTDGFPIWGTSHHDQPLLYLLQPEHKAILFVNINNYSAMDFLSGAHPRTHRDKPFTSPESTSLSGRLVQKVVLTLAMA